MHDKYILDENGEPQLCEDTITWAKWYESRRDPSNTAWIVGKTEIAEGIRVSTVFIALDHNWGDGPPLLFETMVFGGVHEGWQDRYATRKEATEGHERACAMVRESLTKLPD